MKRQSPPLSAVNAPLRGADWPVTGENLQAPANRRPSVRALRHV